MYCVKCGVELSDSEKKCPLCHTPVYFPELQKEGERTYPEFTGGKDEINPRGICFVASFLFAIAAVISLFCNISISGRVSWAGYVVGGLVLAYTVCILPIWFHSPSPAVFAPVDFAAAALFLLYFDLNTGGGWFLPFALPVTGGAALIACSVLILSYYLRRGRLYIYGGASIALGLLSLMIELLLHAVFDIGHSALVWSVYPLLAFSMIGIMLIIIAIVKPLRESLAKMFAL